MNAYARIAKEPKLVFKVGNLTGKISGLVVKEACYYIEPGRIKRRIEATRFVNEYAQFPVRSLHKKFGGEISPPMGVSDKSPRQMPTFVDGTYYSIFRVAA